MLSNTANRKVERAHQAAKMRGRAGAGELWAGSYVRADLVDFLAENPVFGASLGSGGRAPAVEVAAPHEDAGGEANSGAAELSAAASLEAAFDGQDVPVGGAASELLGELEALRGGSAVRPEAPPEPQAAQAPVSLGGLRTGGEGGVGSIAEEGAEAYEEQELGYVVGSDDDPMVQELLRVDKR